MPDTNFAAAVTNPRRRDALGVASNSSLFRRLRPHFSSGRLVDSQGFLYRLILLFAALVTTPFSEVAAKLTITTSSQVRIMAAGALHRKLSHLNVAESQSASNFKRRGEGSVRRF
jgi:hypothetical protein